MTDVTARKEGEHALREALERETATSEVLKVINASPGRLEPVFDAMLAKAVRLCAADAGALATFDGRHFHVVAVLGFPGMGEFPRGPLDPHPETGNGRVAAGEKTVHILDSAAGEAFRSGDPGRRAIVELGGARTQLCVALHKDDKVLGTFTIWRREVRAFDDNQITLLQNFAQQAVIAMENARLLTEQREALERQTATTEVLEVINGSPENLTPVFNAILSKATHLCQAEFGVLWLYRGAFVEVAAHHNVSPVFAEFLTRTPHQVGPSNAHGRLLRGEAMVHITDVTADEAYRSDDPIRRALVELGGGRALLAVPLRKDETFLGDFVMYRKEVGPFSDKQIILLQSFAAQAVIAMENARLLGELRQRTDDLTESLDQQTATSDVLRTISRSSVDLEAVLETLVETVARVCRADQAYMFRRQDDLHHLVASHGLSDEALEFVRTHPFEPNEGTTSGRVVARRQTVHIHDVLQEKDYSYSEGQRVAGFRTMMGIPLMAQDNMVGVFVVTRTRVEPFSDKEIALATGFADQAVIAIENARLFEELRDRQAELRVTFDNMGDGVVMFDAELRLASWNRNFQELLDVPDSFLASRPRLEDYVLLLVQRGELGDRDPDKEVARYRDRATRQWSAERTRPDGRVLEVRNNPVPGGGGVLIYSDVTKRKKAEAEIAAARDAAEAALERQTATADILKVIASSPTDVQPVLDALVKAAVRFCGATDATISLRDGNEMVRMAHEGPLGTSIGIRRPLARDSASARSIYDGRTIHHPDVNALDPVEFATAHRLAAQHGYRAALAAPMLREGVAIGNIVLRKSDRGPFTSQQIGLLETFAAQAVIAIENVRLFTELKESLEQQTATAEVLRVISQSPTDVQPVLDVVAESALRFCGASDVLIALRDGDEVVVAAHKGSLESAASGIRRFPLGRGHLNSRAILHGKTFHVPDIAALDPAEYAGAHEMSLRYGWKAAVVAPMMREGVAAGAILMRKTEVGPFTPRQIMLLETFAAQAVIAIENVRLFTELKESLEQQTATAEILRAISQSPTDVQPVLDVVAKAAVRFCGATDAAIHLRDGDEALSAAHEGPLRASSGHRRPLDRQTGFGTAILEGRTVQIPDIEALNPVQFALSRRLAAEFGFRAVLAAPLLREDTAIGALALRRVEPGSFAPQQIELLETFAAQAVIAIENVRLFTELRDSLERLKAAQANLIQAEKMASLGQLTAGIAHEIKNPLNFVNNFAGLSSELLDELKQAVHALLAEPDEDKRAELQDTMDLLTGNLSKIVEHGRRADGIVKSMLSHSRGGTGEWQECNINTLVEEALNLAYHGARAQDKDFNVTLERDFAAETKLIEVVPQDVTRVFLNLFGNGFYATKRHHLGGADAGYRPTLRVSTRDLGEAVEVRVRDNGTGIQPEVRAKLFQPFFTTKPTGEGTGLGLSISYDIVTQQHGGTIEVESEVGQYTEFTVRLPGSACSGNGGGRVMGVSILIVDDEADVAELFRQQFRREVRQGVYVMHFAQSGEEALTKLEDGIRPELILSDINMPGMDGLGLLREVKGRFADLPVIMVMAYGDDERRRMAREYGAVEFVTKPVDFDMLKRQLRELAAPAA